MGERKTQTMVLGNPRAFKTQKGTGYEFVNLDGEAFSCFDQAFVDAFNKHELKGVEHAYVYETSDNPKWKPTLRAIPGKYEGQSGGWKGGGRGPAGPMFTDPQVAAMCAVFTRQEPFAVVADEVLAWLKGTASAPAPKASEDVKKAPPAPVANGNGVGEHLMTMAAEAFPDKPRIAEAYLKTQSRKYGVPIPELSEGQVAEIVEDLERIGSQRTGAE
jgi:hypothetical protein